MPEKATIFFYRVTIRNPIVKPLLNLTKPNANIKSVINFYIKC